MKKFKNNKETADVWCGMEIEPDTYYTIQDVEIGRWQTDSKVLADIAIGDGIMNDGTDDILDIAVAIAFLRDENTSPKTDDNRTIMTVNRIPLGYTVYPTGAGDNITNGTYGNGPDLKLDINATTVDFQVLGHWYGIGGRIIWEGATLADSCSAMLVAPASTGMTNTTGDFIKVEVIPSSGMHVLVPTTPGTGTWDVDLEATFTNTSILKNTPVPVAGNTGFFDYNSSTNELTVNYTQTGGYNLYDFDANLFRFANKIWGKKADGSESAMETTDVVGKLLYNSWKVRFSLTTVSNTCKIGMIVTTAVKGNT